MTPHHIIAFTENLYRLCLFPCGIKIGNEKDRHITFQSCQDTQFGDLLVSNLSVSSPNYLCDPSLSP